MSQRGWVTHKRLFVLTTMAAVLAACGEDSPTSPTEIVFRASLTDPAGDAVLPEGGAPPSDPVFPDLRTATIEITAADTMKIRVRLEPGTFNRDTTDISLSLDIDQNPATGSPWVDQGLEFIVTLGPSLVRQNVEIFRVLGPGEDDFDFIQGPPVTFGPDGVDAEIPLSLLGGDEGRMSVRVTAQELLEASQRNSFVLDFLPDSTLPSAVVE